MDQNAFRLESARLVLGPMLQVHIAAMHRICSEPGVRRYMFDDQPVAIEFIYEILEQSVANFAARGFGIWMISEKSGDTDIGLCGMRPVEDLGEVEILYALSDSKLGRGYAIEAARAVARYGFERAGLERLIGITDPPNVGSWRVLDKLGMREYRPAAASAHLRYAIISRDEFFGR
jgi:[ribosomal protein S5]-alanine N-acetyltransferase